MKVLLFVFFAKKYVVHSEFAPEGQAFNDASYVKILKIL